VYVGGTYKALPGKLHLFGGLGVDLPAFVMSQTQNPGVERQESMPDPSNPGQPVTITVKGDTETTALLWLPTVVHAGVGGTFYFNDTASLETGVKLSSNGDTEVNVLFAMQR
jgi:hypothetical protein